MPLLKLLVMFSLLYSGSTKQAAGPCPTSFSTDNRTDLCYYYRKNPLPWLDAYSQCLSRTVDGGLLLQTVSVEQFDALQSVKIDQSSLFWLGANNFASFRDTSWHWLDGSPVDAAVITWCPNSTHEIAIGAHCAAYDSKLHCVNNYPCSTRLSAPCVSAPSGVESRVKSKLLSRQTVLGLCSSTSGDSYSNWWTYSLLLLNWFMLFCLCLYLCNHVPVGKGGLILAMLTIFVSFMAIISFAVLWGFQYQNIIQISLAMVILASIAGILLLIAVVMLLSNRAHVQRWTTCMTVACVTIIVECFLMLGLILCTAYCSSYISLASTSLDKDIIASLLASLTMGISIIFYTVILHLLDNPGQERAHAMKPVSVTVAPLPPVQTPARHPSQTNFQASNQRMNPTAPPKKTDQIERATSPVDQRILNEFYTDQPKDMHSYSLDGRQYVVYEVKNFTDIETHQKDLTQAMLLQEAQGLRDAINRAKMSIHGSALAEEINQAQALADKLS